MTGTLPFTQDALFQLNLLLWMVWPPSSPHSSVRPIFREDGFVLQSIAPALRPSIRTQLLAHESGTPIQEKALPDLLLKNQESNTMLPIECKLTGFGASSGSREVKQANILLSVLGPELAASIGLPKPDQWQCYLYYVLEADNHNAMFETLSQLTQHLQDVHIKTNTSGTIGIEIDTDGIYLKAVPYETSPLPSLRNPVPTCVAKLEEGDDPRPLYLIPIDPDIGLKDELYGIRVLEERVRSSVISLIGRRLDDTRFEVHEDEIMQTAIELWGYWEHEPAKSSLLRKIARPYLRELLDGLRRLGADIKYEQRIIRFRAVTPKLAAEIRSRLISRDFARQDVALWESYRQLSFDDVVEGWAE